jgi:L-rhamnose isomerase
LGAVWNYYCAQQDVPVAEEWLKEVKAYEATVLAERK